MEPTPTTAAPTPAKANRAKAEAPMTNDALIEEINSAYRRLDAATEELANADSEVAEHIRRVRLDNAEAILGAKNERTASLYLDGLLDTEEHRRLEADRLHLIVRLQETQAREGF